MPTAKLVQITAWSASRLGDYEKCPRLAKYKHIDRLREPDNVSMARGTAIHEMGAKYGGGKLRKLPEELKRFSEEFTALVKARPEVEKQQAFTKDWKPTDWFGADAWCRIVMDAQYYLPDLHEAHVIDYKTGKVYESNKDQLKLYGLGLLILYPQATVAKAKLWYLDQGVEIEESYPREEMKSLKRYWEKRTKKMLSDTKFVPTPGRQCAWCHFRASNRGPCENG